MGFLDYNVKFLSDRLKMYESEYISDDNTPKEILHEAKVMLKFLADVNDEGYRQTYCYINDKIDAVSRLKQFIISHGDKPFDEEQTSVKKFIYDTKQQNLDTYLNNLIKNIPDEQNLLRKTPDIFYDVLNYCSDLFRDTDCKTEYCFLLRDTLLPYLAFKFWDKHNKISIRPIFVSRKYLSFFDKIQADNSLYGEIQNYIFDCLACGITNLADLVYYVRKIIFSKNHFRQLIKSLNTELSKIDKEKILVIESGYIGTIPVLLSCLDNRVDFRLFTTLPYFYDVYRNKFFTFAFEKMRRFETIICQDALFQISSISDSNIKIVETDNLTIKNLALTQLRIWLDLIKQGQTQM